MPALVQDRVRYGAQERVQERVQDRAQALVQDRARHGTQERRCIRCSFRTRRRRLSGTDDSPGIPVCGHAVCICWST